MKLAKLSKSATALAFLSTLAASAGLIRFPGDQFVFAILGHHLKPVLPLRV